MIKALATTPSGPLLIFGLSKENIVRLQQGLPIHMSMDTFGLPGSFVIFAGDTEESMAHDLIDMRLMDDLPPSA